MLLVTGCAVHAQRSPRPESAAADVTAMLQSSAESWNRGDLDGFLDDYLDSPETTFVTGPGLIHGIAPIRERYLRSYWKGGRPAQLLRFEQLVVRPLGADYALATGRYVLSDRETGAAGPSGNFSLVLRRTPAGWKIVHDHSS